ncbi:MAG: S41 family peptidase [Rikenellaceae bacterium]|nr:S41 family peptidase [Rikenellaceae bacterium]
MYKNSKKTVITPLLIAISLVAGVGLGYLLTPTSSSSEEVQPQEEENSIENSLVFTGDKLSQTLQLISAMYVDPVSVDSLVELAIPQLMEELDPHSSYIPRHEMQEANEPIEGEFDGIGVVFNMSSDTIVVMNVVPKGPSDKMGIQSGDRIMTIDDSLVAGRKIPQDKIVKRLRGKRGTKVKLGIKRYGVDELISFTVKRDKIPLNSVEASFMMTDKIGFVRLSSFAKTSYTEMQKALGELREQGMTKLIFDLRDNGGGLLDQAIYIGEMFLPNGKLVVYTVDRAGNRIEEYSRKDGMYSDLEIVVLINENSASASEILAGAIQDNDQGTIIGRRSFGKALVQRHIPYPDGSALRLTIARYYTPTGRSIQKPYDKGSEEYAMDIYNRYMHDELFNVDSIKLVDSLKYYTPEGKVVYGGGGIMPDIFVPLDTTSVTPYFREVTAKNILYRYTMEYTDKHRKELNAVNNDISKLNAMLDADKTLLDGLVRYAEAKGVKPNTEQIEESKELLMAQIRAYIGRNATLDYSGYYSNIYTIDPTMLKALEVLGETNIN